MKYRIRATHEYKHIHIYARFDHDTRELKWLDQDGGVPFTIDQAEAFERFEAERLIIILEHRMSEEPGTWIVNNVRMEPIE